MPNGKINMLSTKLRVESLESREVPASFGAKGGMSVAFGDVIPIPLDGGQAEYITGTGPGRPATVRIWTQDGLLELAQFSPMDGYTGGIFVATGDLNLDGQQELIVSTAGKTSGRIQIYSFTDGGLQLLSDFMPFGATYTGSVQIATGNVTGDGRQEIVVGKGNGGSTVKVFSFDATVSNAFEIRSFEAYGAGYKGGVTVAAGNIHNTTNTPTNPYNFDYDEIITGRAAQLPQVKIFDVQTPTTIQRASYMAFNTANVANRKGIDVTAGNTDGIRGAEIYVALRNTGTIRAFRGQTGAVITTFRTAPPNYPTVVNFAIGFASNGRRLLDIGDLVTVRGVGAFEQVPIIFPGAFLSPAGVNGSRKAP